MQHATAASDVVPGARFRYGTRVFAVEAVQADGNSLFQAVLNSGLLPGMTVQRLRADLMTFATGIGRPLALRLMNLLSENWKVTFQEYLTRKLGTLGVEGDNFEVVLLSVFLKINLVVFKQSSAGIGVFNVRYFLSQEVKISHFEVPIASEIYLFQRQIRFGINNAVCNHFLHLRLIMDLQAHQIGHITGRTLSTGPASSTSTSLKSPRPANVIAKPATAKVIRNSSTNKPIEILHQSTADVDFAKLQKISELAPQSKSIERKQQSEVKIFNVEIGSDFRLLVDKDVFFVHQDILSEQCGAFRQFVESKFFVKQRQNPRWNGRDIVLKLPKPDAIPVLGFGKLDDHPTHMFRQFLELLYGLAGISRFSSPNIAYIVLIASKLRCEHILQVCDQELSERITSVLPGFLTFSRKFRLQRFRKSQLALFDTQVVDNFTLILKASEQDLSDYFEMPVKQPPVKLMTVALIFLCGLDKGNSIRKRGDFYEISKRLKTCRKWVKIFAKRCRNTKDLSELYSLVCRVRLVNYDCKHDDVSLRDTVMLALTSSQNPNVHNPQSS